MTKTLFTNWGCDVGPDFYLDYFTVPRHRLRTGFSFNDLVAGEKGGVFPNSFPSLLPRLPALGNEKWNTSPSLVSGEARGTPSTRDLDLFSPLAGETAMCESLPTQRGKK